jgi:hypothetical protein
MQNHLIRITQTALETFREPISDGAAG